MLSVEEDQCESLGVDVEMNCVSSRLMFIVSFVRFVDSVLFDRH